MLVKSQPQVAPAGQATSLALAGGKLLYFAPGDIQIARVDRQCIVYFCEALHRLGVDVELITMGVRLLEVETRAAHPLDLYRIHDRFPVTIAPTLAHQSSEGVWWALNRLYVHLTEGIKALTLLRRYERVILYTKNYGPLMLFNLFKQVFRRQLAVVFEAHTLPANAYQRWLLKAVDGVVANSYALQRRLVADGCVAAEQVMGVHQGIDLAMYNQLRVTQAEARVRLGLPLDKKMVVYTGKIYWGYAEVEYLMDAARRLQPQGIELILVGGRGDHVAQWREWVAVAGLTNVTLVGFVPPTVVPYYQLAADVLVLYYPSGIDLNEYRSPGKLFEYMASGRPIIAADYAVLREILGDPPAAVVVPPDDPSRLAQAIVELLDDHAMMATLAQRALARVADFTWEARARQVMSFIASRLEVTL